MTQTDNIFNKALTYQIKHPLKQKYAGISSDPLVFPALYLLLIQIKLIVFIYIYVFISNFN